MPYRADPLPGAPGKMEAVRRFGSHALIKLPESDKPAGAPAARRPPPSVGSGEERDEPGSPPAAGRPPPLRDGTGRDAPGRPPP